MALDPAPLFDDADGPPGGYARWVRTQDGVRLRIGVWPGGDAGKPAPRGTVLLFPGRTEYVEKYGRAARALADQGYGTVAIDWRGQGLADRLIANTGTGHVGRFRDYQLDVAAVVAAVADLDLPRPFFLMAHSMGGCIGLRALMSGLEVDAAVFSAPMWGITFDPPALRPVAWAMGYGLNAVGLGALRAPSTPKGTYVLDEPFEDNNLTRDPDEWAYMVGHAQKHPELNLGGPSVNWLKEALQEMRSLSHLPAPATPALTFYGSDERIVDPARIEARMNTWPNGQLRRYDGALHEIIMEISPVQDDFFAASTAFFDTAATVGQLSSARA